MPAEPRPLQEVYALPDLRARTVTFLLTDVEGSTGAWLDETEAMRRAIQRHDALMSAAVAEAGGRVLTDRGEGDSFFAVFARPADALAAALAAQLALRAERWPKGAEISVRMAIHTGEAEDDYRGPDVNKTARLRSAGHGGQVLVSAVTKLLLEAKLPGGCELIDLGEHRLRDLRGAERVFQLAHASLPADFPRLKTLDPGRHNLPLQLMDMIGRERELQEATKLLHERRLVTLTGPGGSGKTRLAMQAAADSADAYPDGVWFVDLATVFDPDLVLGAAARELGVRQRGGGSLEASIREQLAQKRLLAVIDNCEHVLEASSNAVRVLLGASPEIRVLATSREPLRIAGEAVLRVPPLPDPESARLFVERAALADRDFSLTDDARPALHSICRRLDGMPLAIELAAARVSSLSIGEIDARLQRSFRLLSAPSRSATPRHETIWATIEWSHSLLGADDAELFRRLAVFPGTFGFESVQAVCAGTDEDVLLDRLGGLVDRSLVVREQWPGRSTRYRYLTPVRAYAAEKLELSGDEESTCRAHARHFAELVAGIEPEIRGSRQLEHLTRLDDEQSNVNAALNWSLASEPETAVKLAANVWFYWMMRGQRDAGMEWLERVLANNSGSRYDRALALTGLGSLDARGDPAAVGASLLEAVSEWRGLNRPDREGMALNNLANAYLREDPDTARDLLEQAVDAFRRAGLMPTIPLSNLAGDATLRGDSEAALRYAREALECAEHEGAPRLRALALWQLAKANKLAGDLEHARGHFRAAVPLALQVGSVELTLQMLTFGIELAAATGQPAEAIKLEAAATAAAAAARTEFSPLPAYRRLIDAALASCVERISSEQLDQARTDGAALSLDQAVELALAI